MQAKNLWDSGVVGYLRSRIFKSKETPALFISLSGLFLLQSPCGFPLVKRVPKLRQAGLQKLQYIWKRMFLGSFFMK